MDLLPKPRGLRQAAGFIRRMLRNDRTTGDHVPFNLPLMARQLAELLSTTVATLEARPQPWGASGALYALTFADAQGAARRLVLKQVPDTAAFAFYTDVLRPLDLDSPRMYGVVEVDGQRFLVMERVPQLKGIPVEQKLEDGIRWLLKKDHAIRARLRQTAAHLSVTPSARDAAIPGWVAAVERGLARRRGLLIAGRLTRLLVDHGHVLRELDRVLVTETPLTVSHNDLHPDNLLVSASPRGRLFVVDWLPSVDSILIDLVTLVREVKGKTRERLIGQYRSEMDFPGFDRALRAASLLAALEWLADLLSGEMGEGNGISPALARRAARVYDLLTDLGQEAVR